MLKPSTSSSSGGLPLPPPLPPPNSDHAITSKRKRRPAGTPGIILYNLIIQLGGFIFDKLIDKID